MPTIQEDPLAPASTQFALINRRGLASGAKDMAAAPAGLCPRGLRDTTATAGPRELPVHYFDHQQQLVVGADGQPLIDTVPSLMAAKSYSNTDGQEDWKSGN